MTSTTLKQKIANIQQDIDGLSKDKENPFFKSSYVDLNQIIDALRPLELKYKISITCPLTNEMGRPAISLHVTDLEGDKIFAINTVTLPDLQDPQKMGSAITYYRRYMLMSFFNLKAEDDDGNSASEKSEPKAKNYKKPENYNDYEI